MTNSAEDVDVRMRPDEFEAAVQHNPDAILILDDEGRVVACNPAAEALLGRSHDALIGHPFGFPLVAARTEIDILRPQGPVVAEVTVVEVDLDDEHRYVVTARDVSARKASEDALRNFVSMTSHEFRTPLTAIVGFSQTMQANWADLDDDTKLHHLSIIEKQATRLARLAKDTLQIARLDSDAMEPLREPIEMAEAVHQVLEVMGIASTVDLDVAPGLVFVDVDHLQEILINLVTNAQKYGAPPIEISGSVVGEQYELAVRDHGPGVAEDFVPDLFKRFTRSHSRRERRQQGSGLGLAIVSGLAHVNDGTIRYEGGDDGASFIVSVPMATPYDADD